MDPKDVTKFKALFENQRKNLIYTGKILNEDFNLQQDDLPDEVDLTSSEIEQNMRIRLRNRETFFMKKIDAALKRIEEGVFGDCEDCGDEIGLRRLEARPTATLCVTCKEEQEHNERNFIDARKRKSVGTMAKFTA